MPDKNPTPPAPAADMVSVAADKLAKLMEQNRNVKAIHLQTLYDVKQALKSLEAMAKLLPNKKLSNPLELLNILKGDTLKAFEEHGNILAAFIEKYSFVNEMEELKEPEQPATPGADGKK